MVVTQHAGNSCAVAPAEPRGVTRRRFARVALIELHPRGLPCAAMDNAVRLGSPRVSACSYTDRSCVAVTAGGAGFAGFSVT